ncbi:MAG: hypothetical protein WCL08_13020 [Verrucomicrobiota bacterium]
MATYLSNELAGTTDGKTSAPVAANLRQRGVITGGRLKRYRSTITFNAQASGDVIQLACLPAGSVFAYGTLINSASTATATIAIGTVATPAKYRAAAASTSVDTLAVFSTTAVQSADVFAADELVYATVGTAALPASGTLVIDLYVSVIS